MSATASAPSVTFALDADRVGWIVFDDPAGRANVFDAATQAALRDALAAATDSPAVAWVVISAKEKIFIAGADLKSLAALPDAAAAEAFAREGQALFERLNTARVPVVCAIHGACAGGGFELALACHWRIATDAPVTRIGLPETGIGTIPGWGGSVRLPRTVGAKAALDHILRGQLIDTREAFANGLVHEVVPAAQLREHAKSIALHLRAAGLQPVPAHPAVGPELFAELRRKTAARGGGHQPALLAAIDAVEQTQSRPMAEALAIEARLFGSVTAGVVCKNLVHVFFLRDAAKKRSLAGWFETTPGAAAIAGAPVRTVGVVGAGVMGSGIAQWLAAAGFQVVFRDVDSAALARGLEVVRRLCDESVKRGKLTAAEASTAQQRIATTTAWDGFATCDMAIEAIVEDVAAKRKLFTELAVVMSPDAILASNTSALPIEAIAGHVPNPARTVGIHFFNPVSRMPLVEIVLAPATSAPTAARTLSLVKALGKSPVICRSSPGFLVTRVLFFYLNEAVRLWEEGASTYAIDLALRSFGWPMGPLRLIDEVGLDVTDFIFGEMAHYFPQRFVRSTACSHLLAAGLKGRKNGASRGFYRYENGGEALNDAETRPLAAPRDATPPPPAAGDPIELLMRVMIEEAQRCLDEGVVQSPEDIDFALLSGAGFPAFRGGLMRYARTVTATPTRATVTS